ncbi:16S rRNA (guanine(527)-N(7))-methyltransferase RsmG [Comamonas serinivorans]|uniref:Ribosomal RNA small subunit methyltransferase G n=1 Tax=Comamonas serinivorans TaxID=1082851 RepID=A0A1Y0EIF4_9BURK|nr:16S rRNA (guanine(527)-N(7))-methyltransferase RsmG [Comamonas serinivorans]ARU03384.1 16S rRNA (guanine(527)-N(7))-methyltransferase RsmG [Comamonas serinivorans]
MTAQGAEERQVLIDGADALGVALTSSQVDALIRYLDLLSRWGKVYNLTAVLHRPEMMTTHILDCLAVIPPLRKRCLDPAAATPVQLLDVGSGAGLPGVVLAIVVPELQVTCIDTVAKKAAYIQHAGLQLGLKNLKAVHGRIEQHAVHYDVVCSRAFASLIDFTRWSRNCLKPQGVWMAMKGKQLAEEFEALARDQVDVFHVEPLTVPGLQAERCIVWMRPQVQP